MIVKILRNAKGRVVFKQSKDNITLFYVRTKINHKQRRVLIRDAVETIQKFGITSERPYVYGDLLFYEKIDNLPATVKFKVKGIDKFPKQKPNITVKTLKQL